MTVNNNSPIQDYVHPDDQTQPFEVTPGFKPFTIKRFVRKDLVLSLWIRLVLVNWLSILASAVCLLVSYNRWIQSLQNRLSRGRKFDFRKMDTACSSDSLGTWRSDNETAAKTSLQKWICALSVFIAIILTHLLCQMWGNRPGVEFLKKINSSSEENKISPSFVYVLNRK